jgi:hypothetical protein
MSVSHTHLILTIPIANITFQVHVDLYLDYYNSFLIALFPMSGYENTSGTLVPN